MSEFRAMFQEIKADLTALRTTQATHDGLIEGPQHAQGRGIERGQGHGDSRMDVPGYGERRARHPAGPPFATGSGMLG